ncbi:MAG: hypothetical protein VX904_10650, partial [Planctomycetota bacterium]|nr:hypothetical protein [Planctomycetota bacterium]
SISSHRNVGKSIALEYLLNLPAGIAKKRIHFPLKLVFGSDGDRQTEPCEQTPNQKRFTATHPLMIHGKTFL